MTYNLDASHHTLVLCIECGKGAVASWCLSRTRQVLTGKVGPDRAFRGNRVAVLLHCSSLNRR